MPLVEDADRRARRARGALTLALAMTLTSTWPASGQVEGQREAEGWFSGHHYFAAPLADPRDPRFGAALVYSDVLEAPGPPRERAPFTFPRPDEAGVTQGQAAMGGTLPLWSRRLADGGISLSVQTGVWGRFRIGLPSKDLVATDWIVAAPFELRDGRFTSRFRLKHWSAHLGDELIRETGAQRIEFGEDGFDWLLGYDVLDRVRVYGGGMWIFHSNTEQEPVVIADVTDDFAVQLGADTERFPWADGHVGYVFGVDYKAAQRTDWDGQISVIAGPSARIGEGSARVLARFFDGPSPLGEFFLTPERYWSIEVTFDLLGEPGR